MVKCFIYIICSSFNITNVKQIFLRFFYNLIVIIYRSSYANNDIIYYLQHTIHNKLSLDNTCHIKCSCQLTNTNIRICCIRINVVYMIVSWTPVHPLLSLTICHIYIYIYASNTLGLLASRIPSTLVTITGTYN